MNVATVVLKHRAWHLLQVVPDGLRSREAEKSTSGLTEPEQARDR